MLVICMKKQAFYIEIRFNLTKISLKREEVAIWLPQYITSIIYSPTILARLKFPRVFELFKNGLVQGFGYVRNKSPHYLLIWYFQNIKLKTNIRFSDPFLSERKVTDDPFLFSLLKTCAKVASLVWHKVCILLPHLICRGKVAKLTMGQFCWS